MKNLPHVLVGSTQMEREVLDKLNFPETAGRGDSVNSRSSDGREK